jgi:hypothetical protein
VRDLYTQAQLRQTAHNDAKYRMIDTYDDATGEAIEKYT